MNDMQEERILASECVILSENAKHDPDCVNIAHSLSRRGLTQATVTSICARGYTGGHYGTPIALLL